MSKFGTLESLGHIFFFKSTNCFDVYWVVKTSGRLIQFFVAFSENLNFTKMNQISRESVKYKFIVE